MIQKVVIWMRKSRCLLGALLLVLATSGSVSSGSAGETKESVTDQLSYSSDGQSSSGQYVVIGWNDLGMHCINGSYSQIAILPPFNTLMAQVIRRGNPPQVVTSGISLQYSIEKNTTVRGKTDFWEYVEALFGLPLPLGTGLTGNGLSGYMEPVGDHFEARGIPVLPYDDRMRWNPYQVATITLREGIGGRIKKTTKTILPVSDELNCAKCHAAGGDATENIMDTGTVEGNIIAVHDYYQPTCNLMQNRPVLCARCHADNALNLPGDGSSKSLSLAMHGWHSAFPDAGCYDCHPGAGTQCNRSAIQGMGYAGDTPNCDACHGGLGDLADSIIKGRRPWVDEPACEQCHGINHSTGQDLYRNSKGHGGGKVYCAACHNSPHAWWPSKLDEDNYQPKRYQGEPFSMRDCSICHTRRQIGHNPHTTYLLPKQTVKED